MSSFFLAKAQVLAQDASVLCLHALRNWERIRRAQLKSLHKREFSSAGGPIPFDLLGMFKLVLRGQWHGLSDETRERALRVRLDFIVFTGIEPNRGDLPDATTICRFRNRLVITCSHQRSLKEVKLQLQHANLKVNRAKGAICDATIIASRARPKNELEMDDAQPDAPSLEMLCADVQARWTKNGKKSNLDYKGYVSQTNGDMLKRYGTNNLQHKAHRKKPLLNSHKQLNALMGKVRFKIEQSYGTMKRRFHLSRAHYIGVIKTEGQIIWTALELNVLKAHINLNRYVHHNSLFSRK